MLIAGVDEAGRGPLIGSVVAAAVILPPDHAIIGLDDSKKLTASRRERLYEQILHYALDWSIAEATHAEIDQINILQATLLAMQRAINGLTLQPSLVRIDGNRCPLSRWPCQAIIHGDQLHAEISAASILAKVTRDRQMKVLDQQYPQFGLERHKGYPTRSHHEALELYGVLPHHRRSFRPVREALEAAKSGNQPANARKHQ